MNKIQRFITVSLDAILIDGAFSWSAGGSAPKCASSDAIPIQYYLSITLII